MSENRSSFTGKLGFVLAAAGSAVGLGNIWRFPYLAAEYGGGIFLLVYIILALTLGFTLMCAEIALGRKTGKSAIEAFGSLNKKYTFVGWIASIIPMLILPYYSVIGGWVIKYFYVFISGGAEKSAADSYFVDFISHPIEPIGWFFLFMALTALIVLLGVDKGIEKVSKIAMPVLIVLTLIVAVYSMTLDGAMDGIKYYLLPDFSKFSATTVLAAMGQLFYSMSIAMGIMITYGSYMKKEVNLESSVKQIEIFDTSIAFLAGLMIIPAVFAFGGEEAVSKGAGLMFMTLPKVFDTMAGGAIIGAIFFLLVFFAAITSSISLMETVVSIVTDKTRLNRKLACLVVFIGSILIGIPSALGNGTGPLSFIALGELKILDMFDALTNSIMMPIVALLTCIFVGYIIKPKAIIEEIELTKPFKMKTFFTIVIKYIAPVCIILILGFSIYETIGNALGVKTV